jgi:hypothetical protein
MWPRVSKCFQVAGDRMFNPRQESEREEAKARSEKNTEAGKKGGEAKASARRSSSERNENATTRASESVSETAFEVLKENQEVKIEIVPTDNAPFEELLGMFVALGRGMTIADRVRCQNEWNALQFNQRLEALRFARSQLREWQTRPTGKIAQPWNYLRERHWERNAPRLLAQTRGPNRSEEAQARAAKAFMEEAG